jgi:hypothetical protein
MANNLTNLGQEYCLLGTNTPNGGIANLAAFIRLLAVGSVPDKNGSGFNQVAAGNGYPAGGFAISRPNWTLVLQSGDNLIRLVDILITAAGGSIPNIAGAYIVNAGGLPLGWWERSALTLASGDSLLLDDLTIKAL